MNARNSASSGPSLMITAFRQPAESDVMMTDSIGLLLQPSQYSQV
jgi:hypothetical protein